ncbi:hypothetical protein HGB13_00015 [bacterium]|nr:hypothetical protein [bacterium]
MTTLTESNYYERGTKALTCSKIKDFVTCPNYFYRKHITNELEEESSDAFLIGGLVDKLLSGEDFGKMYEVVARRTPKLKAEAEERGVKLMLQSQLDEIIEVADAVDQTDAWKTIKEKGIFQSILQIPYKINEHFDSLAGKPDVYWIDDEATCFIVDLKTAASAEHRKAYFQAMGFHYDWQLANYRFLLKALHPEIKKFRCFNLTVGKTKNIYGVELFEYDDFAIERAMFEINNVIEKIAAEKDYKKYNPSFLKPVPFGEFNVEGKVGKFDDRGGEDE